MKASWHLVFMLALMVGSAGANAQLASNQGGSGGVRVDRVEVSGVTAFPSQRIDEVTAQFTGRVLYIEDLVDLRDRLTALYVDNGYVNSGAILPQQAVAGGVLQIRVVEGSLQTVAIENPGRLRESLLQSRILQSLAAPFSLEALQQALLSLERDPRVETLRGSIQPTAAPGVAMLQLQVEETNPVFASVSANNYLSPSIGSEQLQVSFAHINLSGNADEFRISASKSDGYEAGSLRYRYPLFRLGAAVNLYYSIGDTVVVEKPFKLIDIRADTETAGASAEKAFRLSESDQLILTVGIEKKSSTTSLLGQGFDFSLGSVDGRSRASVGFAGLEWRREGREQAWAVSSTLRQGFDIWDATDIPNRPDGKFASWINQAEYLRRLDNDAVLALTLNSQFSRDSLQAFEQLSLGGPASLHGYRQNELVKDNGWELLAEYRLPIPGRLGLPGAELMLIPRLGFGRAWDSEEYPNIDRSDSLSSAGIGLAWRLQNHWALRLDWAHRFERRNRFGDELQDDGIYLGVSYDF